MKKILVFGGSFSAGGVETVMMNIIRNLSSQYSFSVVAMREDTAKYDEELKNLSVTLYKIPSMSKQGVKSFYRQVLEIMRKNNFDAVHINGTHSSVLLLHAACVAGINQRIFHAHNTQDTFLNRIPVKAVRTLAKSVLSLAIRRNATTYISCGRSAGEFVFGKKYVVNNKVKVIPNSVDLKAFCTINKSDVINYRQQLKFDIPSDALVLGHAGRFTKVKNQIFAIKIVEQLNKNGISAVLCLAGEGEEMHACREYVKAHSLNNQVLFMGNVNNMHAFYKALDVFVLPSLFEGFPVSLIEAQACGLPILMADTITDEADLGLGLVHSLPLEDISKWVQMAPRIKDKRRFSVTDHTNAILHSYSIEHLVEKMDQLYANE